MRISNRRGRRLPGEVKELRRNIERWRRTRTKLSPMPAELWNGAVGMAGEYGASAIARMLGIDYKSLRSRAVDADAASKTAGEGRGAGFIEMRPAAEPSTSMSGSALGHPCPAEFSGTARPAETVLEMCDAGGMKLVLRCGGGVEIDVIRLVEVFRRSWMARCRTGHGCGLGPPFDRKGAR